MGGCSLCVGITALWQVGADRLIFHQNISYLMELNLMEITFVSLIPLHFILLKPFSECITTSITTTGSSTSRGGRETLDLLS
jgi:hypothetical protein